MNMNPSRRPLAKLSQFGITSIHRRQPLMVAWWSAAFPGFGHFLLNHYLRATFLTLSEVIFNTLSHINEAIVLSFCGRFAQAKAILEPRWILGYIIIYFIAMWDSYRLTIYQNKLCYLAEFEKEPLPNLRFYASEIQYVQPKNPLTASLLSLFFPGFGQLYNHRIGLAFYAISWWWLYISLSHVHESLIYILTGRIMDSIPVLQPHWLMFMPSVIGGSIYHAYINAKEHNQLYSREQRQYLIQRYSSSSVRIFGKSGGDA
ncbi:TM2 domain-containing membrane protein YozV [Paenibacillus harenae]|uniref:TM2 domain-containing membrane protein YozV n=1 Tax=Paenibacillus harenae TaxID=306543 RepID=A0ABT9UA44_PAEHA|nr:TM2 domain-containing membrane protein YozV [Paenibacillus harenae]